MPSKPHFIFEVETRIPEALTLNAIVLSPRSYKPEDLESACQNSSLTSTTKHLPKVLFPAIQYILYDFFVLAHSTGLYNRQLKLWEALAKVKMVEVYQLTVGLMHKRLLPAYDLLFRDRKGKSLIYSIVTDLEVNDEQINYLSCLKDFLLRAKGKSGIVGLIACFTVPYPQSVLSYVNEITAGNHPIGRWESLVSGLGIPLNLLTMYPPNSSAIPANDSAQPAQGKINFQLAHPNLTKNKT